MNSLKRLIGTPIFLKKALEDLTATRHFCLDRTSWKDEKSTEGNGNDSDQDKEKLHKHKNRDKYPTTGKDLKPTTSIESFQIYKKIPKDIDELFLKRNERLRYRKMNDLYKKEINQLFLKEKDLMKDNQSNLDSKKLSPVAFKRNTVFDEKLDSMVKTLLSETKLVISKMARLSSPSTSEKGVSPVTFEELKKKLMMRKKTVDPCACELPGESSRSGESPGSAGQSGGSNAHNPPGSSSGEVIVSPYVDDKGNIDYTRAVVKSSSQGDATARDITKKLIVDPPKPLPTFEIPNTPRQTEIIIIRGDGSIESKNENISQVDHGISEKTSKISHPESGGHGNSKTKESKKCEEKVLETIRKKEVSKCDEEEKKPSLQMKQDCKTKNAEEKGHAIYDKEKAPSLTRQDCKPKSMDQETEKNSNQVKKTVSTWTSEKCASKINPGLKEETKKFDLEEKKPSPQMKQDCKTKNSEEKGQPKYDKEQAKPLKSQDCKPKRMGQKTEIKSDQVKEKVSTWTSEKCASKINPGLKEETKKSEQDKGKVSSQIRHHDFKTQPKVFRTGCPREKDSSKKGDSKPKVNTDKVDIVKFETCGENQKRVEDSGTKKTKTSEKEKMSDKPPKDEPDGKCG